MISQLLVLMTVAAGWAGALGEDAHDGPEAAPSAPVVERTPGLSVTTYLPPDAIRALELSEALDEMVARLSDPAQAVEAVTDQFEKLPLPAHRLVAVELLLNDYERAPAGDWAARLASALGYEGRIGETGTKRLLGGLTERRLAARRTATDFQSETNREDAFRGFLSSDSAQRNRVVDELDAESRRALYERLGYESESAARRAQRRQAERTRLAAWRQAHPARTLTSRREEIRARLDEIERDLKPHRSALEREIQSALEAERSTWLCKWARWCRSEKEIADEVAARHAGTFEEPEREKSSLGRELSELAELEAIERRDRDSEGGVAERQARDLERASERVGASFLPRRLARLIGEYERERANPATSRARVAELREILDAIQALPAASLELLRNQETIEANQEVRRREENLRAAFLLSAEPETKASLEAQAWDAAQAMLNGLKLPPDYIAEVEKWFRFVPEYLVRDDGAIGLRYRLTPTEKLLDRQWEQALAGAVRPEGNIDDLGVRMVVKETFSPPMNEGQSLLFFTALRGRGLESKSFTELVDRSAVSDGGAQESGDELKAAALIGGVAALVAAGPQAVVTSLSQVATQQFWKGRLKDAGYGVVLDLAHQLAEHADAAIHGREHDFNFTTRPLAAAAGGAVVGQVVRAAPGPGSVALSGVAAAGAYENWMDGNYVTAATDGVFAALPFVHTRQRGVKASDSAAPETKPVPEVSAAPPATPAEPLLNLRGRRLSTVKANDRIHLWQKSGKIREVLFSRILENGDIEVSEGGRLKIYPRSELTFWEPPTPLEDYAYIHQAGGKPPAEVIYQKVTLRRTSVRVTKLENGSLEYRNTENGVVFRPKSGVEWWLESGGVEQATGAGYELAPGQSRELSFVEKFRTDQIGVLYQVKGGFEVRNPLYPTQVELNAVQVELQRGNTLRDIETRFILN